LIPDVHILKSGSKVVLELPFTYQTEVYHLVCLFACFLLLVCLFAGWLACFLVGLLVCWLACLFAGWLACLFAGWLGLAWLGWLAC
jgi:hypothetical protein